MNKIINFIANKTWLKEDYDYRPEAYKKNMPDWYKKAHRYMINPVTNKPITQKNGDYALSWKSCPALMDTFMSGYILKTPCDITFFINNDEKIDCKIEDAKYQSFCTKRAPMEEFNHPIGYYKEHFAWLGEWGIESPEGYSVLYMTPANMFDLPFMNTVGIIDGDKLSMPGSLPFFIIEGWTGTIPAGTPYLHIIPFKRDSWDSKLIFPDKKDIVKNQKINNKLFRSNPTGGVYINNFWTKKEFN